MGRSNMNASYIAGFFDGEGSAMVLTIRCVRNNHVFYRLRPVVKIAQAQKTILLEIRAYLGIGTVVKSKDCYNLQINGNDGVIRFVDEIASLCHIKGSQLLSLKRLALFQNNSIGNVPYTKEQIEHMLELRDAVFQTNTWSRSRIKQKYPKEVVMREQFFSDTSKWIKGRDERMACIGRNNRYR